MWQKKSTRARKKPSVLCNGCLLYTSDFAADAELPVTEQIDSQIALLSAKRPIHKYIAYFQAYTNTYAPVEYLRKIFTEALAHPSVVALSIGTLSLIHIYLL